MCTEAVAAFRKLSLETPNRDLNRCNECDRTFVNELALSQHNDAVHDDSSCYSGPSTERDDEANQHLCTDCDEYFVNSYALNQHLGSSVHAYCHICERWFKGKAACDAHRAALSH
ncbi:hypothetical protein EDC01DRAFT_728394 [Geopyxis carbonaria]|nr:hypothetical protein EDC01DRAFT_728394 [Geopyxis carbonaria]